MQLLRTYGTCYDTITAIDWSADGQFLAAASKDLTARVYSLNPIPGWTPPTLAGHKDALVGVFFTTAATQQAAQLAGQPPVVLYTVSKDGALFGWSLSGQHTQPAAAAAAAAADDDSDAEEAGDADAGKEQQQQQQQLPSLAQGTWGLSCKHYFMQRGARLSAVDYHKPSGVLVVGFSNGLFELYQLPEFQVLQTLSVSHERISSAAFNAGGDWLALGCAKLGQLLVWEWRSEGYVLRQQGHYFDVSCACYSPDGAIIATGGCCCVVNATAVLLLRVSCSCCSSLQAGVSPCRSGSCA
jgi:periodic tryptophan protein 2